MNKKVFDTADVVALYLGKTFSHKQMPKIKAVVEFLVGNGANFTYTDKVLHNKIQNILVKKYEWLGSLRYNHADFENWKDNIIHNHGEELTLSK